MTIRNTIIIIILCLVFSIVAADPAKNGGPLVSDSSAGTDILDAVSAGPAVPRPLFSRGRSEELQDAVAGIPNPEAPLVPAVFAPSGGTTLVDLGGPPRGGGDGSFDPPPNNPGPILSPCGPAPAP